MCDIASKLVIISGPSGAGKDTIVNELLKMDDTFSISVSATSRPPRGKEQEGINYYFITEDEFVKRINEGEFVEYTKYGTKYYGTLKSDVASRIEKGKTVILVIEVEGAENVRRMYPGVLSIFIMPPSEEVLEKRLRCRQTDSEEDICRRMSIAKCEIEESKNYDYIVVNDALEEAVAKAYSIIKEHIR